MIKPNGLFNHPLRISNVQDVRTLEPNHPNCINFLVNLCFRLLVQSQQRPCLWETIIRDKLHDIRGGFKESDRLVSRACSMQSGCYGLLMETLGILSRTTTRYTTQIHQFHNTAWLMATDSRRFKDWTMQTVLRSLLNATTTCGKFPVSRRILKFFNNA